MNKFLTLVILMATTGAPALAQSLSLSPNVAQQPVPQFSRCGSSVAISSSTAATVLLSDGQLAGSSLHVCGFLIQVVSGTSPTFKLVYGTKASTDCDTGAVNVTGAFAGTGVYTSSALGLQLNLPLGKELCIVAGGTSPVLAGSVTYGYW
jgi:hypothetical protein